MPETLMDEEGEFYEDDISDQGYNPHSHTEINSAELREALNSLELLRGDLYLGLQVTNLTLIDQFIMGYRAPHASRIFQNR